jgi:hypothetical protein
MPWRTALRAGRRADCTTHSRVHEGNESSRVRLASSQSQAATNNPPSPALRARVRHRSSQWSDRAQTAGWRTHIRTPLSARLLVSVCPAVWQRRNGPHGRCGLSLLPVFELRASSPTAGTQHMERNRTEQQTEGGERGGRRCLTRSVNWPAIAHCHLLVGTTVHSLLTFSPTQRAEQTQKASERWTSLSMTLSPI